MGSTRYRQVVDGFAADIRAGQLVPGTRLPTHRRLAREHGMALVTASRVYAELEAMGLVSGEAGRGTFVRDTALSPGHGVDQQSVAAGMLDLSFNHPALPGQGELLRQALRQLAVTGDLDALLRYQPHGGRLHERALVARHLAQRGLPAEAAQVLLVDGAQHGLTIAAMALLRPGDAVAVDALTYPGFKLLASAHRIELVPVPARGQGMDPDALDALCRRRRIQAVYAMPTMHNPMGWVMSTSQRRRLVAVVRRHGLRLIEDAAYAFLAEDAPPPLASLAPECTVYVSGFSKSVATGLRVGFVCVPAAWEARFARAIRATTWNTPGVMTAIVCGWLDDGTVDRLETEKREDARARQRLVAERLGQLRPVGHAASYFTWLPLPTEVRADRVATALQQKGIAVSTAEPFAATAQVPHAIRMALGSVALPALARALDGVAQVVDAQAVGC